MMISCAKKQGNPFFEDYDTPYGAVPFDKISIEHYMPAFVEGMNRQKLEIDAMAGNPEAPTFENTIAAMDYSGELLNKVSSVFFGLISSHTSDEMQAIAQELSPLLSEHSDNIRLNAPLFKRIESLYNNRDSLNLNTEQQRLLEKYYKNFVRSGAALDESRQERLREINKEEALLTLQYSDNVLKETNDYRLVIDKEEDLSGLPQTVVEAAAEAAAGAGLEGKWVFTLHNPSRLPFLQYADNRELREKILKAYYMRGDNNNEADNKEIVRKLVNLRVEKAQLLGYNTFAEYVLEETMAKNPKNVYDFLDGIWPRALRQAKKEVTELQKLIDREGGKFKLQAWDWWYYAEKLRKEKYQLDEEELKPYFELQNVRQGLFTVCNKLFGINLTPVNNVPVYHPDVEVFEVTDADGSYLGLFYSDYFPRESKRGGAWMSNFREQYVKNEQNVRPHIYNVGNFTKPSGNTPSLLSLDEVETMFHEFGHTLHGMLSQCSYPSLNGTNVTRDFVELPSQIMENWCTHPEVLKMYARHYKTGEPMPEELIEKIQRAATFNQGFITTELMSAAYLDMYWHDLSEQKDYDVNQFETDCLSRIGLIPEIVVRYRSTYFNHIFNNNYHAGYYSYLWAEVLDADAFQAFVENGLFDQKTATAFRQNILERGGTDEPMTLYRKFRGADPDPKALLERRGI
ncbi:MAG TPA: M3 family metallopeptidase [Bacteroidales bacterium]|nr:M3 family metallopeptidase [Bacteroidales bacterium]